MRVFLVIIFFLTSTYSTFAHPDVLCKTKLQKYYMFKVYEITFCRQAGINYDEIFQTNFSITLHYKISSSSRWITDRSFSEINKNYRLTDAEKKSYKKHFDGFFPSVKNGDEINMEFSPQYGAKFYFNGKLFGEITDVTFATRTANIWLHPNSTFKDTRDFLFAGE